MKPAGSIRIINCLIILLMISFLLEGCSSSPSIIPSPSVVKATTITPKPSPSITPIPTQIATPTLRPTDISTDTATPTATIESQFDRLTNLCIHEVEGMPSIEGVIVLAPGLLIDKPTYLHDLKTGENISLGETWHQVVSPNRERLIYETSATVDLIDSAGQKLGSIPNPEYLLTPVLWVDDQNILVYRNNGWETPGTWFVVNPVTEEQREFSFKLPPDYDVIAYAPEITDVLLMNSSLSHFVYESSDLDGIPLILWDIQSNQEVKRIFGTEGKDAAWNEVGSQIVFSAPPNLKHRSRVYNNFIDDLPYVESGFDLFVMDQTGVIRRITRFSATINYYPMSLSWSPDEKQIAFFLYRELSYEGEYAIVDVETGYVTNYCELVHLAEHPSVPGFMIDPPPSVWSPDGKYLLINRVKSNPDFSPDYTVLLVDLKDGAAWEIAKDSYAVGWMLPPP